MADTLTLTVEPRTTLGKKVKRLRQSLITPIHLYGPGIDPLALQCDTKTILRVLSQAGMNAPVSISVKDEEGEYLAFVREIQWHPLKTEMPHVDFLRVDIRQEITAAVPIVLTGSFAAARGTKGTIVQQLRELEVQALPLNMPSEVSVDLALLPDTVDVLRVADIPIPNSVTLITDPDAPVARFEVAREEVSTSDEEGAAPGVDPAQESTVAPG